MGLNSHSGFVLIERTELAQEVGVMHRRPSPHHGWFRFIALRMRFPQGFVPLYGPHGHHVAQQIRPNTSYPWPQQQRNSISVPAEVPFALSSIWNITRCLKLQIIFESDI